MAVYLCPIATILQYFTDVGIILPGGKIKTYLAASSTPTATYTDSTGGTSNGNPIVLNSAGRLPNVSIWQTGGFAIKVVVTDANDNSIYVFDQITGINDPSTFAALLANPASGSGADLIANAMRSYDLISTVRAANTPSLSAGQTLVIDVQAATSPGDNLGGLFLWNASSSLTDDGITVIKPTAVSGNGRYLRQNQYVQNAVTVNADYTFVLADAYRQVIHTDANPYQWNIPTNAAVAYPVGTILTVINQSAASITVAGGSPPSILAWSNGGVSAPTVVQGYMTSRFEKTATDTWQQLDNTYSVIRNTAFTANLTDMTTTIQGSVAYFQIGGQIGLYVGSAITGTSNSTAFTINNLPAALTPSAKRIVPCMFQDNGAVIGGWASISGTTITFGTGINNNAAGFTAAGFKGLPLGFQLSYQQ